MFTLTCDCFPLSLYVLLLIIAAIIIIARRFYKLRKLSKAIYFSFSILVIIFLYILIQGHCFISDEFYPHIVSELGFVILTLGIIDYFRKQFQNREEEIKKEIDDIAQKDKEDARLIIRAIMSSTYSFRTVKGLSEETTLSEERVKEILEYFLSMKTAEKRKNREGVDVWRLVNKA